VKAQEFLDYVEKSKSKNMWKEYRNGLKKFSEWYGKDLDTVLAERKKQDLESGDSAGRRYFEHVCADSRSILGLQALRKTLRAGQNA
jgi:hypothetical protein